MKFKIKVKKWARAFRAMTALIILILVLALVIIQSIKFGVVLGQMSKPPLPPPVIEAIDTLPNGDTEISYPYLVTRYRDFTS